MYIPKINKVNTIGAEKDLKEKLISHIKSELQDPSQMRIDKYFNNTITDSILDL